MKRNKKKLRAQRKFAQGAFIPSQNPLPSTPTSAAVSHASHKAVNAPGPVIQNHSQVNDILTRMSLGQAHPHDLQPVVRIEYKSYIFDKQETTQKKKSKDTGIHKKKYALRNRSRALNPNSRRTSTTDSEDTPLSYLTRRDPEAIQSENAAVADVEESPTEVASDTLPRPVISEPATASPMASSSVASAANGRPEKTVIHVPPPKLPTINEENLNPVRTVMTLRQRTGKRCGHEDFQYEFSDTASLRVDSTIGDPDFVLDEISSISTKSDFSTKRTRPKSKKKTVKTAQTSSILPRPGVDVTSADYSSLSGAYNLPVNVPSALTADWVWTHYKPGCRNNSKSPTPNRTDIETRSIAAESSGTNDSNYFKMPELPVRFTKRSKNCYTRLFTNLHDLLNFQPTKNEPTCNKCKRCELLPKYKKVASKLPISDANEPDILEISPRDVYDYDSDDDGFKFLRRGREFVHKVLTTKRFPIWLSNLEMNLKKTMFQDEHKLGTLKRNLILENNDAMDAIVTKVITRVDYLARCLNEDKKELNQVKSRRRLRSSKGTGLSHGISKKNPRMKVPGPRRSRKSVVVKPIEDVPVVGKAIVDMPVVAEPAVDEPMADDLMTDEPMADEPMMDEPMADEPMADEPMANEPTADEPVIMERADETEPPVVPSTAEQTADSSTEPRLLVMVTPLEEMVEQGLVRSTFIVNPVDARKTTPGTSISTVSNHQPTQGKKRLSSQQAGPSRQLPRLSSQQAGPSRQPPRLSSQQAGPSRQPPRLSSQQAGPSRQPPRLSIQAGPSRQPSRLSSQQAGPSRQPPRPSSQQAGPSMQPPRLCSQQAGPSRQPLRPRPSGQPPRPSLQPPRPNRHPPRPNNQPPRPRYHAAPVFRPTLEQFKDPIAYIKRIEAIAVNYGICKIIPPAGFDVPCHLDNNCMFTTINQYLGRLYQRWGPTARESTAIQTYVAKLSNTRERDQFSRAPMFDGVELDLVKLYHIVLENGGIGELLAHGDKWARIAEQMNLVSPRGKPDQKKLEKLYCKHVLPYESLSQSDREINQKIVDQVWAARSQSVLKRSNRPLHYQRIMLGETESDDDEELSLSAEAMELRIVGKQCFDRIEECTAKGRTMNLGTFRRIASQIQAMRYPNGAVPTIAAIERDYWNILSLGNEHLCVLSAFIDTSVDNLGHTSDPDGPGGSHPWNLKRLSENSNNVLRSLGKTLSVTVPTLCLNQLHSTNCWHMDPHKLSWMDYMHEGATKIWYAVSEPDSELFRRTMEIVVPSAVQNKGIWLTSDTIMVPPAHLTEKGVRLQRIEQNPGEFIVVFPGAYASSVATGLTISESIYFENKNWLYGIDQIFQQMHRDCEPAMFSSTLLLLRIASDPEVSFEVLPQVLVFAKALLYDEYEARREANKYKCRIIEEQTDRTEFLPISWPNQEECSLCRTPLVLSKTCRYNDSRLLMCLKHGLRVYECASVALRGQPPPVTLLYKHDELHAIIQKLERRIQKEITEMITGPRISSYMVKYNTWPGRYYKTKRITPLSTSERISQQLH